MARLSDSDIAFLGSGTTLENVEKDFSDWHQGRDYYYAWILLVDDPVWVQAFNSTSRNLRCFLHGEYLRQPHVTILPAGFVQQGSVAVRKLADICRQTPPFALQLGALTSFASSPYLAIKDPLQSLRRLRSNLRQIAADPNSVISDEDYVPHLTVGIYDGIYKTDKVLEYINRYGEKPSPPFTAINLTFARYHTSTIKGPLEAIATIEIGSGDIKLHNQHDLFAG